MGAQQSTGQGNDANADNGLTKTCYYELLGVARDATDDDIKKAYRKRALELHPDRNYGDVDNATRRFAEVQSAYEVLSDPQERAWYDSHREAILRGADDDDLDGHPPEFNNIRLTTTEEILSLIRGFNASIPFTNEPTGFYGILNETFSHLADEEVAAGAFEGHESPRYPAFGESDDEFESLVKPFYVAWAGFATAKSFAWKDKYRLSDAPDRRVRRMMEKENKKLREDAAREFNDAVRFLVSFVRKRDPRYQANSQTADERREALRSAAAAQAARSRAANRERLDEENSVPEWARARDDDLDAGKDHFPESESDHDVEHIECVVCDKIFKSEKSYQAHEKSKKHTKAVQQLKRQMRNEGLELDLDDQVVDNAIGTQASDASPDEASTRDESPTSQSATVPTTPEEGNRDSKLRLSENSQDDDDDDEYAPRSTIEQRLGSAGGDASRTSGSVEQEEVDASDMTHELSKTSLSQYQLDVEPSDDKPPQKVGKAKAKREKKAARNNAATLEEHTCGVCRETFSSRSKLFSHIRDLDHAALKTVSSAKDKKHKKR